MNKHLFWVCWLVMGVALGLGSLVVLSCDNGGGSGGDDETSYGVDLEGMYQVVVNTTYNDCPDGTLDVEDWFLSIEQSKDLAQATVFWQEEGAGSEKNKLFTGDVFGNLIIRNQVQKTQIGDEKCIQLQIVYYRLEINPETGAVTGWLIDDIVYVGDSCSPSTVNCRTERTIESVNQTADDDTAADDDNDDNDDNDDSVPT